MPLAYPPCLPEPAASNSSFFCIVLCCQPLSVSLALAVGCFWHQWYFVPAQHSLPKIKIINRQRHVTWNRLYEDLRCSMRGNSPWAGPLRVRGGRLCRRKSRARRQNVRFGSQVGEVSLADLIGESCITVTKRGWSHRERLAAAKANICWSSCRVL